MKKISSIILFWMLSITIASAEIPKAYLDITALNQKQWPAQYRITLTIPQDHHAYLNAGDEGGYIPVSFDSDAQLTASGLTINRLQTPAGVYDDLVKAQVLREQGAYTLTLTQTSAKSLNSKSAPLAVKYQLCNDLTHECFRPQTTQVDLPLPPPALIEATADDDESSQGLMDNLLMLFKNHQDNTALIFGLMFIAGLLSVATPCVYPMLPITSMFIVNRANGVAKKEKQHALAYLAGIVGTYTLLGLIAGMTGGAFNTLMQSAWVNLGFALFFAFFALALLGFYELGFMQNEVYTLDRRSSQVKGLTGTWLMGSVAGLVISPCVGPIVFALLLQVADNIADKAAALAALNQQVTFWDRLSIASTGSLMMAGFGAGVGIPFFIISVVKFKKLPKAGYWMNKIKVAFGLMILYFAYVYFDKGMGVLGAAPATSSALAVGTVSIWIAVMHCNVLTLLPADAAPNQKIYRYCGLMALIFGGWLITAGLWQLPIFSTAQAITTTSGNTQTAGHTGLPIHTEAGIAWHRNYAAAQKLAQQTGKPIFIDFYASWCANCIAFAAETANNHALNDALRNHAIAVKLIDKEAEFEQFRAHPDHRHLKIGLPYFAILSPDGLVVWSGTDYKATKKMVSVLTQWTG